MTTRDDLITFLVNSEKPRDAAMRNTGAGFVVLSHLRLLFTFNAGPAEVTTQAARRGSLLVDELLTDQQLHGWYW